MESVEIKARGIDNGKFPIVLTKRIVEILREPEMSIEVKAGQITEDVCRLLDSIGYVVTAKKAMDGWMMLKAVKAKRQ